MCFPSKKVRRGSWQYSFNSNLREAAFYFSGQATKEGRRGGGGLRGGHPEKNLKII